MRFCVEKPSMGCTTSQERRYVNQTFFLQLNRGCLDIFVQHMLQLAIDISYSE